MSDPHAEKIAVSAPPPISAATSIIMVIGCRIAKLIGFMLVVSTESADFAADVAGDSLRLAERKLQHLA